MDRIMGMGSTKGQFPCFLPQSAGSFLLEYQPPKRISPCKRMAGDLSYRGANVVEGLASFPSDQHPRHMIIAMLVRPVLPLVP